MAGACDQLGRLRVLSWLCEAVYNMAARVASSALLGHGDRRARGRGKKDRIREAGMWRWCVCEVRTCACLLLCEVLLFPLCVGAVDVCFMINSWIKFEHLDFSFDVSGTRRTYAGRSTDTRQRPERSRLTRATTYIVYPPHELTPTARPHMKVDGAIVYSRVSIVTRRRTTAYAPA